MQLEDLLADYRHNFTARDCERIEQLKLWAQVKPTLQALAYGIKLPNGMVARTK